MQPKFTFYTLLLFWALAGCGRPATYLFPGLIQTGYQRAGEKTGNEVKADSTQTTATGTAGLPDTTFWAAAPAGPGKAGSRAVLVGHHLQQQLRPQASKINSLHIAPAPAFKKKNQLHKTRPEEEKQASRFGKLGFILSLAGLAGLLLWALLPILATVGFFLTLGGIIFSSLALSEIKKDPEKFKNRRQARAGLIVGIVTLSLYALVGIVLVVALLAFFSGGWS